MHDRGLGLMRHIPVLAEKSIRTSMPRRGKGMAPERSRRKNEVCAPAGRARRQKRDAQRDSCGGRHSIAPGDDIMHDYAAVTGAVGRRAVMPGA